ncbi:MTH1187 family thiamine-binding protein [Methylobacterium sp. WL30]|uniref:MTH1187 family thiamine-binding protein n=1 Tax=unclassified Methylobacterium TaxID=2615210 RepID=UPI0011CBA15B|nr:MULTISPECIES: MTH1187 family thiamine-binding protein [unclassified Methylobacterium]MCJ2039978.1 MTH1187 family thiamine-binding protein [Methylobacterium sp. J-059]MCJ2079482.1 MTH1187 family thiamine-binding protein [Methylobacterium sp. E-016]MCJ2112172.1 MTH1187 family thiamine-binding protein [Methylobacterium sp. E-025]TXM94653.1 MTH1187 family thiamine-binding protein [Methylobacterium sp. WL116]TXN41106.1 MTH1187 family thiamine-binding protein [Methylobacterium sp. WL93]
MKVVADLCIVPMGVGPSVSPYVREIKTILETSGLDAEMHANGTNIEGELADICRLIELCEERLSQIGVQRVFYTMAFSSRRDKAQSMADKLTAVS